MKKIFLILLLITAAVAQAQSPVKGYWQGWIHITANDSLTMGMYVTEYDDSLQVELDSPDQYSVGIKTDAATFSDNLITWKQKSLYASYKGTYNPETQTIEGKFTQGGKSLPLTFYRGYERTVINRPQEPQPPYPYEETEIVLKDRKNQYNLVTGTLTLPKEQPKALVILVSGSGWQDRDETIFGHKPFKVIADDLTRKGYAVFRYDDLPTAVFINATTYDFADAVQLIMDSLSQLPRLKDVPVGLAGHSEGSLVSFITAAKDKRVQFIISLSGVAQEMTDVLMYQIRVLSSGDPQVEQVMKVSEGMYQAVRKSPSPAAARENVAKVWDSYANKMTPEEQKMNKMTVMDKVAAIQNLCTPWFYELLKYQPKQSLKKIQCPVLAIGGTKDTQVEAKSNLPLMEKYLPKNPSHQFVTIESANHLLQICETGQLEEYAKIEQTISPEVLTIISEWLSKIVK